MARDFYHNMTPQKLLTAAAITATTTSATCDLDGYDSALFLITVGTDAALDSGDYWTITMQDSTDDSTYAVVGASEVFGDNDGTAITATSGVLAIINETTVDDDVLVVAQYTGDKRYVQIVLTETSDTGDISTPVCISAVKLNPKYAPASVQA